MTTATRPSPQDELASEEAPVEPAPAPEVILVLARILVTQAFIEAGLAMPVNDNE